MSEKFREQLAEHDALQAATTQTLALPAPPLLMQAFNVATPDDFLLETIRRIRPRYLLLPNLVIFATNIPKQRLGGRTVATPFQRSVRGNDNVAKPHRPRRLYRVGLQSCHVPVKVAPRPYSGQSATDTHFGEAGQDYEASGGRVKSELELSLVQIRENKYLFGRT